MPVKVQCQSCDKVLKAPDKARGRTLKCPDCAAPIRIPSGKTKAPAAVGSSRASRQPSEDELLGNIDLSRAEDRATKICPKCAVEITEDVIECPECGVNIETGQLSERQRRKRERKGPDPNEYWSKVWREPTKFVKAYTSFAVRMALYATVFSVLASGALLTRQWCYNRHMEAIELDLDKDGIEYNEKGIEISIGANSSGTKFLGKLYQKSTVLPAPHVLSSKTPPVLLWGFLTVVFACGVAGTFWTLWVTVVDATLQKKKLNRFKFELFAIISLGVKAYVWPVFLSLPLVILGGAAIYLLGGLDNPVMTGGLAAVVVLLAVFVFPVAITHMAQKYTYPAWLAVPMIKTSLKNVVPLMYWFLVAGCVLLPALAVLGVLGGMAAVAGSEEGTTVLSELWANGQTAIVDMMAGVTGWTKEGFARYTFHELPAFGLMVAVIGFPIWLVASFGALFAMRANGVFGYFFAKDLDFESAHNENEIAGFGPRYIAAIVDFLLIPTVVFVGTKNRQLMMLNLVLFLALFATYALPGGGEMLLPLLAAVAVLWAWQYNALLESGYEQCTIGKNGLGLKVVDTQNERLTTRAGTSRFFGKALGVLTLGLGFVMCVADPKRRTLHDRMAKSLVVWRGDDERTE